jgi:diguanylate cyclase
MSIARHVRSFLPTAYAFGAIFFGAMALAALRSVIPGEPFIFELLFLGAVGVALGRLTIAADSRSPPREGADAGRQETSAKAETIDRVLRHLAKVLQTHLSDSDAYGERLDGANKRLSQQQTLGPINEIVLALISDNRDMRNKLFEVRNQLEESRVQVVHLQTNLERAEEVGMRDVVTAIGNRRFFDACLAEETERARRTGDVLCLALADIDRFKHVNDRFGHLVGDRLLRLFANILVQNVRQQDKVARFGGEEFALMFPGARLPEAMTALERIRGVLESKQWTVEPSGERVGKVTASFGVARLRANETAGELLRRADELLYEAKAQGRNRVVSDRAEDRAPSPSNGIRSRRAAAS